MSLFPFTTELFVRLSLVTNSWFSISHSLFNGLYWASALLVPWRPRFLSGSRTTSLFHPNSHISALVLLDFPAAFAELKRVPLLQTLLFAHFRAISSHFLLSQWLLPLSSPWTFPLGSNSIWQNTSGLSSGSTFLVSLNILCHVASFSYLDSNTMILYDLSLDVQIGKYKCRFSYGFLISFQIQTFSMAFHGVVSILEIRMVFLKVLGRLTAEGKRWVNGLSVSLSLISHAVFSNFPSSSHCIQKSWNRSV